MNAMVLLACVNAGRSAGAAGRRHVRIASAAPQAATGVCVCVCARPMLQCLHRKGGKAGIVVQPLVCGCSTATLCARHLYALRHGANIAYHYYYGLAQSTLLHRAACMLWAWQYVLVP